MRPFAAALIALAAGCTFTERLTVELPVVAGGTGADLVASDGGAVALTEARVRFADLRLEEPPDEDLALALVSALVPTAHAHPGHDYPGAVAGELLGTFDVDLLAPDAELGAAPCYEGDYATGRVHAVDAVLAGVHATPDGTERPFRLEVGADQEIGGIPFEVTLDAARPPAAVVLRFDAGAALAQVDWSQPDTDGDGVLTTADGTAANTARFGVVATPSWSLTLD